MIQQELYLNGYLMDLSSETKISLTIQANKIGDLQNRYGNFVPKFTLPYTVNNKEAIDLSHVINSATNYPYQYAKCVYLENGVELISDGLAKIEQCANGDFSVIVNEGNVDFFKAIDGLTVGELYDKDSTFYWELYTALNSRIKNKYYIFPVIDWYDNPAYFLDGKINIEKTLPVALVSGMMSRLQTKIGFTFTGDYIGSSDLNDSVLTPDNFKLDENDLTTLKTSGKIVYDSTLQAPEGYFLTSFILEENNGTEINNVAPVHNTFTGAFTNNLFTPTTLLVGKLALQSTLTIKWVQTQNYTIFQTRHERSYFVVSRIKRTSDGAVLAEVTSETISHKLVGSAGGPPAQTTNSVNISFDTGDVQFAPGQTYFVEHSVVAETHPNIESIMYVFENTSEFSFTPTGILSYGSQIFFTSIFKMTVKDVLMDLLRMHGVFVQTDNYTKNVQFTYWNTVVKNKSIAKDWSDKYVPKSKTIFFSSGSYGQKNNCIFSNVSDMDKDLGKGSFLIEDTTLDKELDVIKLNHSATEQGARYVGLNVPSIKGFDTSNKWTSPGWRILTLNSQTVSSGVVWKYQTVELSHPNDSLFVPIASFKGFENYIVNRHNEFINSLQEFKGMTADFRLSVIDIIGFDFAVPIQLEVPQESISGYFYVGKITKGSDNFSRCELMKLQ